MLSMDDHALAAASEIAAHPERKALSHLYAAAALTLLPVAVALWFCVPAAIWWAYATATQ